ncbi:MAG: putative cell division protein, ESCRT-III/Snf7 family [Candidatus Methanohalarchaeum thermophilum]|uniref:Cell division protein, ESCRT-III/Snf7 family n=1 Tax=Methanohalarchaeum thermophilum TaxID=1903181 RepID=A0A1Q6DSL5_METT1|nr:MAG: putative cell division protein, ESCRT-III/Snf7 family [Candidatus Methanohalarchaeum thermophilum]
MGLKNYFKRKIFGVPREEKELKRNMRYRKAKGKINSYISNLKSLQKKVMKQGREASEINDEKFLKRQAKKYLALQDRIYRGKKLLMRMEEARVNREIVNLSGDFVDFAQDVADSIEEGAEVKDISSAQLEMEKAMNKAESIDEALSTAVDMTSEGILTKGEFDHEKIEEVIESMSSDEAREEETELDKEISDNLEKIEEEMKE